MRTTAALGLLAVAVASTALLSGCAAGDLVSKEEERHFATRADAPTRGDLAFVLPDWVPSDATDIDLRTKTDGPGNVLRFRSEAAPEGCSASTFAKEPLLTASWWKTAPKSGARCGEWDTFSADGYTYAFTTETRTFSDTTLKGGTPSPAPSGTPTSSPTSTP